MLPKNSIGAEIGVSAGDFSQEILNVLAPRELVLIDPWDLLGAQHTEDSRRWFLNTEHMHKTYLSVVQHFKDQPSVKIVRGFSQECLDRYPDDHFNWVYVDAAHEYHAVRAEIDLSIKKVKAGGFVTGDDLFKSDGDRKGVQDAVLDTLLACGLPPKLNVLNKNDPPGQADGPSRLGQQFIIPVTEEMKKTLV
jgi:hypothetical protein